MERVPDQGEVDEAEEDDVQLVVAGGNSAKASESAEEALDLVAATVEVAVVGPGRIAVAGRRDQRAVAHASCRVWSP